MLPRLLFPLLWLLSLSGLVACGAPAAGDDCSTQAYFCGDPSTALECRDGTWTALPCRGPGGCADSAGAITCDVSAAVAGDACAASSDGRGVCAQGGTALLECRQGAFVQTASCSRCSEDAGRLVCEP